MFLANVLRFLHELACWRTPAFSANQKKLVVKSDKSDGKLIAQNLSD
jgi:hypothetical protein